MHVDRTKFNDLVTIVTQAPPWEKNKLASVRVLLRALSEGKHDAPMQILERWTWKLARATRKVQDRKASQVYPEAKRLLGALANSRGHRHEENAVKLVKTAHEQSLEVGVALLASAEGYTPRANKLLDEAREGLGELPDVAMALAENLPAPKTTPSRRRRRRRKKKGAAPAEGQATAVEQNGEGEAPAEGEAGAKPKRRRRRRKPAAAGDGAEPEAQPATEPEPAA